MTPIVDIVQMWIGVPQNDQEAICLYATACIVTVIVFDALVGLFRFAGRHLSRL